MIGRLLDRFRIVAKLGQGGMGSVWKAEDTLLHRPVALKLLADDLADSPPAKRRFLREARAASSLSHPSVATVFGAGEAEHQVYIALALIDGETVSDCVARQPFEVGDAVRLGIAVAEALGHAHSRGVIHRDVTGRNIMIDRDGRVFVLDFGLAFMTDRTRLTTSETGMGTAAYMAPETALGRDADPRSDLYSLGVVLYEALTGTLPFQHERAEGLLYAAVHEPPEPPRARRPALPEWVDRVILKLLEKQPENRYQDADGLILDLRQAGGTEQGLRVTHAMVAAGTSHETPTRGHVLAAVPFRDLSLPDAGAGDGELLAQGLTEAVRVSLGSVAGLDVVPLALPGDAAADAALVRQRARQAGARLLLSGSVRRIGTRVRLAYQVTDVVTEKRLAGETMDGSAAELFDLEDRLIEGVLSAVRAPGSEGKARRVGPRDPASHESYLSAMAHLRRTDDEASLEAGIELLERLRATQGESATIHAALGRAYLNKYRLRSGKAWEIKAAEACQRALELDPHAPEVFVTLGELHVSTGRFEEAAAAFHQALELRQEYAEAWMGLSLAHLKGNRHAEAEEACRKVIALRPDDWLGYNRLGIIFFRQGQFARAIEPWRMVTKLAPRNSFGHLNLAGAYFHVDRMQDALEEYGRALDIQPTADALAGQGSVLYYMRQYEAAADTFERAIALKPMDARLWGNLASACSDLPGRESRRAEALDRAIALTLERLEINPGSAEDWSLLGGWRADRGQRDPAVEAIEKAVALAPEDASVLALAGRACNSLGDRPGALRWIGEAVRRGYGVESLVRNPALAWLEGDPRFRRMIETRSVEQAGFLQSNDHPGGRT